MKWESNETFSQLYEDLPIGYSDHTVGIETPIAAVVLGSPVIEKHFTLDSKKIGMDNQMAMEPDGFRPMIASCKTAWSALGSRQRVVSEVEVSQRANMRRSIVSKRGIKAGEVIELADLDFKRPGDGYSPADIKVVVGKKAVLDIEPDEVIYPAMIQ